MMLFGVAIDLSFLIIWVILQKLASYAFEWLGELTGMTQVFRKTMEYVFDGATLALVVTYVARDLWLSAHRLWRSG
jgi:uncharacterized membrane protein (DUF485 family)